MNTKSYDYIPLENKLKDIIYRTLDIQIDDLCNEEKNYPLLSRKFGVYPYQMLVLFTRIENEMKIKLSEKAVVEGKFNSYVDILSMVEAAVENRC